MNVNQEGSALIDLRYHYYLAPWSASRPTNSITQTIAHTKIQTLVGEILDLQAQSTNYPHDQENVFENESTLLPIPAMAGYAIGNIFLATQYILSLIASNNQNTRKLYFHQYEAGLAGLLGLGILGTVVFEWLLDSKELTSMKEALYWGWNLILTAIFLESCCLLSGWLPLLFCIIVVFVTGFVVGTEYSNCGTMMKTLNQI
ncbi:hypothetical protein METBIDRAFT_13438 [Metschnikowia bicuspidata var. bicuspidata NRRL YB-4993]|uniref:Uncharacterized protein n=1 Tax=Metschnikowia bicuspidata var. bicuspidata NRRL YB-4993 TaxID=869754 RepID=A0A1A0H4W9_9ASCO|nr:hypothetical protein METBIDRAFT_13438 [Metschnikowia bicuspidata var. bicuspidata NRRL YB-4993]OBA19124.1 hypothetical protein METBIDRAFT_13438 [Metschnikowia bicuspidata var. bicuspidata NRRL YB-4993]